MKFSTKSVVLLYSLLLSDLIYCADSTQQPVKLPVNHVARNFDITALENGQITINCLNYNALNDLGESILKTDNSESEYRKLISFKDCFNNETSHANYKNFQLEELLQTDENKTFDEIVVYFDNFALVDENVFLKNFKFSHYESINFEKVGFQSTEFLSKLVVNSELSIFNCNLIDFNHFTNNKLSAVVSVSNTILNLNINNLGKLPELSKFVLDNNDYDDDDVFNVPKLFEFNPKLRRISIDNSVKKIELHENVFFGLVELEILSLINNQLEYISENLFHGLTNLQRISLDENKFTNLQENTFLQNPNLSFLNLDGNKLLKFSGYFELVEAIVEKHQISVSASGKAVLVTGCESPLVWCLAKKLDDIGFTVFAGFSKKHDNEDADLLKDEGTGRMKILQLDVTSETQILEASLYVTEHLPDGAEGLWAIIHGETMIALGEIEWIPFSVLRKSIDINLLGAARLTQIMLPLIRRAGGRIVFLSSALAKIPAPIRGAQCATQAGIEGLAICLRQELRPRGVDVSVIATGEFSAGNAWLDDSSLLEQAKMMWSSLSDEQRRSYGEDYFETAIRSLEKYTRAEPDFRPALKCLTDAIVRTFPLPRYTPITASEKIQTFVAEHLPPSVYETIYLK